jgi:hypothetical protein
MSAQSVVQMLKMRYFMYITKRQYPKGATTHLITYLHYVILVMRRSIVIRYRKLRMEVVDELKERKSRCLRAPRGVVGINAHGANATSH